MQNENGSRTAPTGSHGGLLIVGLFVLLIVGLVTAFLVAVEQPRRARNASVELIRTKFGGEVETVSTCPEWLVDTFAEDYFTYVVSVRVGHAEPVAREDAGYLAPLRDLDRLEIDLPPGTTGIVERLPYSRDLYDLRLVNATALPHPEDVPQLTDLSLVNPAWGPGDARMLSRYENLERVRLAIPDPAICTEAIAAVSRLPRLGELRLEYSQVPAAALDHLAHAKSLLLLDLSRTGLTGEGVRKLARIPSLQHLQLDNNYFSGGNVRVGTFGRSFPVLANEIGDDDMRHVAKLPDLRFLQLDRTDVGDAGLEHVAELPILQYLYLEEAPVGNAGVRQLTKLPHLRRLNLRKNWNARAIIDDAAVDDVATLTDLEMLLLHNTDISREGLAKLMMALPTTQIAPSRPRHQPSPLKKKQLERETIGQ